MGHSLYPDLDYKDGKNDFRDTTDKPADILEMRDKEKSKIKNDAIKFKELER